MPKVGMERLEMTEEPGKTEKGEQTEKKMEKTKKEENKGKIPENKEQKIIMQIENLSKTYYQGKIPVHALRSACITVKKGEFLAIMGPSGSGKSTLLALIGTLERATDGKIILDGTNLTEVPEKLLPRVRREKIGFIFQHFNLIPTLSALENVELAMRFSRMPKKEREERAKNLLEELNLGDRLSHKPAELSGGEQQRVSIARALANKPALILADEPTGEVDSKTRDSIVQIFKQLSERGQTILIVTHDPEVAKECTRVLRITDGMIKDY
jgi:putative ABC transport system ATP-binding protein